jgi:hypothetical protein
MIGLGSSIAKPGKIGKRIIRDGLVLKHDYNAGAVEPCSTGAVDINADAANNEYIDVGAIPITTNDVSMSAWVYVTEFVDYAGVISNRNNGGAYQGVAIRTLNENTFSLVIDPSSGALKSSISGVKNINQWYHVCGVMDRDGSQYLYVDGVLEASRDISDKADSLTHTTNFFIGKNYDTNEFRGYICNVGYWNAALTQAQVKSIMLKDYAGLSASEKTGLVSWWNLDSVIDSADIKDGGTTVYDNHHGGGDTLGSELVTSYEVTESGTTGKWTTYGTSTLTSNNNILTSTIGGGGEDANEGAKYEITDVAGYTAEKTYKVEADIWLGTYVPDPTNQFKIYLGGVQQGITLSTTQTTFTAYITTNDTTDLMIYQNDADDTEGTFFISNVSVKLVNGNTGTLL